jgi:hypothetical protein
MNAPKALEIEQLIELGISVKKTDEK